MDGAEGRKREEGEGGRLDEGKKRERGRIENG